MILERLEQTNKKAALALRMLVDKYRFKELERILTREVRLCCSGTPMGSNDNLKAPNTGEATAS